MYLNFDVACSIYALGAKYMNLSFVQNETRSHHCMYLRRVLRVTTLRSGLFSVSRDCVCEHGRSNRTQKSHTPQPRHVQLTVCGGQVRRGDSISSRFEIIESLHSNHCTRRVPVSLLPIWDSSGAVSASIQTPEPAYRYLTQSLTLSVIGRGGRATQIVSIRLREVAS